MKAKILLIIVIALSLFSCKGGSAQPDRYTKFDSLIDNGKGIAFGDERDIYLFCDKDNWEALSPFIQGIIEQEVLLVYPEKYFNLIHLDISEYSAYSKYRNLMFIGDLESSGAVSKHMKESLAPDFITRVQQTGGDLFVAKNYATRDQLIIYLLASNPLNLKKVAAVQNDKIFDVLLQRLVMRQGYQAYQQKVIPVHFWEHYPFSMQIPDNYRLYSNDKEGRFLSLLYRARRQEREIPDKYINVYYEEMDEEDFGIEWFMEKRKELGDKYFEGDILTEETMRKSQTRLAGFDALKLMGAWINEKHMIGGAFQSFAFHHEGKSYIIDNVVYFPAGDKLPILTELFAISNSFKVKEAN